LDDRRSSRSGNEEGLQGRDFLRYRWIQPVSIGELSVKRALFLIEHVHFRGDDDTTPGLPALNNHYGMSSKRSVRFSVDLLVWDHSRYLSAISHKGQPQVPGRGRASLPKIVRTVENSHGRYSNVAALPAPHRISGRPSLVVRIASTPRLFTFQSLKIMRYTTPIACPGWYVIVDPRSCKSQGTLNSL
jgi:hypothetical protein